MTETKNMFVYLNVEHMSLLQKDVWILHIR